METQPTDVATEELLAVVRASWDPAVDALDHLPVGFGAHHWRARVDGAPRYFVTLDRLGDRHTLQTLQAAYAGASALAGAGLDFVAAPVEPFGVPFGNRAVSVTPWLDGTAATSTDSISTAAMLRRLHGVDPASLGVELPSWCPVVGPDLADQVAARLHEPWSGGPYGARSREAVAAGLDDIRRWTVRYSELGGVALTRPWVPTHGEPGQHNQLVTRSGSVLVDWESLKLAPAERDLRTLNAGDPGMLELFDLEWRLAEISTYVTWFAGPHGDTADDRSAHEDLVYELTRRSYP